MPRSGQVTRPRPKLWPRGFNISGGGLFSVVSVCGCVCLFASRPMITLEPFKIYSWNCYRSKIYGQKLGRARRRLHFDAPRHVWRSSLTMKQKAAVSAVQGLLSPLERWGIPPPLSFSSRFLSAPLPSHTPPLPLPLETGPLNPAKGSGGALQAPPAGSGAKPRPQTHLLASLSLENATVLSVGPEFCIKTGDWIKHNDK